MPRYAHTKRISDILIKWFLLPYKEGDVDQLCVATTRLMAVLIQRAVTLRLLLLAVEESDGSTSKGGVMSLHYAFEPAPEVVPGQILLVYVANRIHSILFQSSASELASRQCAMKSVTDNVRQLIRHLTREADQARQAEITQETSRIIGGITALAESTGDERGRT